MPSDRSRRDQRGRKIAADTGRAFGGSLIFALPMLMTMEMWWLGFYADRSRLALLLTMNIPLLVVLSYYAGFERTFELFDDLRDAAVAYGVGILTSIIILFGFGILTPSMPLREIVGKVGVQAVPASIGAMLGRTLLGESKAKPREGREGYASNLCLMAIGALFLTLNIAPTEEMVLISYKMSEWHAITMAVLSMVLMHIFVYAAGFCGQAEMATSQVSAFLRYTVTGYAIVVLISLYVLWTFGRTEDVSISQTVMAVTVLGFPGAIGAAAARLIL